MLLAARQGRRDSRDDSTMRSPTRCSVDSSSAQSRMSNEGDGRNAASGMHRSWSESATRDVSMMHYRPYGDNSNGRTIHDAPDRGGGGEASESHTLASDNWQHNSASTITHQWRSSNGSYDASHKATKDRYDKAFKPHHHSHHNEMFMHGMIMMIDGIGLAMVAGSTLLEGFVLWKAFFHSYWNTFPVSLLFWFLGRACQVIGLMILISKSNPPHAILSRCLSSFTGTDDVRFATISTTAVTVFVV